MIFKYEKEIMSVKTLAIIGKTSIMDIVKLGKDNKYNGFFMLKGYKIEIVNNNPEDKKVTKPRKTVPYIFNGLEVFENLTTYQIEHITRTKKDTIRLLMKKEGDFHVTGHWVLSKKDPIKNTPIVPLVGYNEYRTFYGNLKILMAFLDITKPSHVVRYAIENKGHYTEGDKVIKRGM